MKQKINILVAGLFFLVFIHQAYGQSSAEQLRKARILMSDYQDAALFKDMNDGTYDPSWEGIFKSLFRTNAIIFDIPFRVDGKRFREGSLPSESGTETATIKIYQEQLTPDKYIETIRNAYDLYSITDFSYLFVETKFDTTSLGSQNKILFEFRKTFGNTSWSVRDSKSYLFEIRFFDGQPLITSVRAVDENIAKTDVALTFLNADLSRPLTDLVAHIRFEFDESINNTKLLAKTDQTGIIKPGLIANRATIKIDSIISADGQRFSIADDWKLNGYKVSNQPSGGFVVPLFPWKWNGFSWSPKSYVGIISQSENRLKNFSSDSDFSNKNGYMFGIGMEVSKLFSFSQISSVFARGSQTPEKRNGNHRRNSYLGAGSGIYYYQYHYRITSKGFLQNPYPYLDRREEPLEVIVKGTTFEEKVTSKGVSMPMFFEFRKNMAKRNGLLRAYSVQTGVNLMILFKTTSDLSGTFTRHGYYEQFNRQLMINDSFYNYYTKVEKSYKDDITRSEVQPALIIRLNGFFNVSKNKTDNLLDVGIQAFVPFRTSSSNTFHFATGNDEFHSLSNSKTKPFNYFVGLSIGYSFIKYRLN
ncbi:MAG: hypothetical protein IH597_12775 [Bacteroidales bacterium]|nr:hypothetical protein [Bacteroidales bacterium]